MDREIAIQKSLRHPNIVILLGSDQQDDKLFIFLELMEMSLAKFLRSLVLDEDAALYVLHECAQALAYLHSKNLFHRDIKPGNILLDASGRIKISDFGFSAGFGNSYQRFTQCGTIEYLAPEIIEEQKQTEKVDIWCLGVLLYEIMHKKLPFEAKNMKILLENIKTKPIVFRPDISAQAREIIIRCLQADPKTRPSASEILSYACLQRYKTGYLPQIFSSAQPPSNVSSPQVVPPRQNVRFMNADVPLQNSSDNRQTLLSQSQMGQHGNFSRKQSKASEQNSFLGRKVGSSGTQTYSAPRATSEDVRLRGIGSSMISSANNNGQRSNNLNHDAFLNSSGINPLNVDMGKMVQRTNRRGESVVEPDFSQRQTPIRTEANDSHVRGLSPHSIQALNQSQVVYQNNLNNSTYWQKASFSRADPERERRAYTPNHINISRPSKLTESYLQVSHPDTQRPKSPISVSQVNTNQQTTPLKSPKISSHQTALYLGQIEPSKLFQDRISNQSKKEQIYSPSANNQGPTSIIRGGPVDQIRVSNLPMFREGQPAQQENLAHYTLVSSNLQAVYPAIAQGRTQTLTSIINPPLKVKSNGVIYNSGIQIQQGRSITPDVIYPRNQ